MHVSWLILLRPVLDAQKHSWKAKFGDENRPKLPDSSAGQQYSLYSCSKLCHSRTIGVVAYKQVKTSLSSTKNYRNTFQFNLDFLWTMATIVSFSLVKPVLVIILCLAKILLFAELNFCFCQECWQLWVIDSSGSGIIHQVEAFQADVRDTIIILSFMASYRHEWYGK